MPNQLCEKCKLKEESTDFHDVSKSSSHQDFTVKRREEDGRKLLCQPQFEAVQSCMKLNQGNITSCREVWNDFRKCRDSRIELNG